MACLFLFFLFSSDIGLVKNIFYNTVVTRYVKHIEHYRVRISFGDIQIESPNANNIA